jgi:hypothetical protein
MFRPLTAVCPYRLLPLLVKPLSRLLSSEKRPDISGAMPPNPPGDSFSLMIEPEEPDA